MGQREGHDPSGCHSLHGRAGAGERKGKTVKPAATHFKLTRNAGLSFARSLREAIHLHPQSWGFSSRSRLGSASANGGFWDHAAKPPSLTCLRQLFPILQLRIKITSVTAVRNHITTTALKNICQRYTKCREELITTTLIKADTHRTSGEDTLG